MPEAAASMRMAAEMAAADLAASRAEELPSFLARASNTSGILYK